MSDTSSGSQTGPAETSPDSTGTADVARFRRTRRPTDGCRARVPGPGGSQQTHRWARCRAGAPRCRASAPRRGHYPSPVMSAQHPPGSGTAEGAAYADRFAVETPEMVAARERAVHLSGTSPVEPAVGATLAVLASTVGARSVVSIGSGGGLAGLWLLRGMRPDGVLTALDGDPEQLRAARKALAQGGIPAGRARLIFGTPGEVLPRLSPGAYDMVSCAGPPREYAEHLGALLGLVRIGGAMTLHGLLDGGRIADRAARDPETVAWREIVRTVREDEALLSSVLPIGAGLLVATKRQ